MSSYYIYLIASLPMLHFGSKPPFSFEKFIRMCEGLIPEDDKTVLAGISYSGSYLYGGAQPTLRRWQAFDITLRNELAKIRAARRKTDPSRYLRSDGLQEPSIAHIAMNAYRNTSILEAEKMLDQERWRFLDELAIGHYFDIDFLITYACKLLILERWGSIESADKPRLIEDAVKTN